jgi:hypothetical protein
MKLSGLLLVNTVLAAGFGLAFLAVPATLGLQYGIPLDAGGQFVGRLLGAATFFARSAPEGDPGVQALCKALAVANGLGGIVSAMAALNGIGNALVWSSVVIYAGLAAAFAIPAMKRAAATSP